MWVGDFRLRLRWDVDVAVHCCVSRVSPVFCVGSAGEEECADGLADDANSSFCNTVELVNVSGCKLAIDGVGVAELEESCGHEFAAMGC